MSTPEAPRPDEPLAPSAPMPASRPADGVPTHGVPAYGLPAHGVPAYGLPAHGVPAGGASAHGATADAVPVQAVPAWGTRDHAVPTNDVPVRATAAHGVQAHDVPVRARPVHGVASAGVPKPRRGGAPSVHGRGRSVPVRRTAAAQVRDPHDLDNASLSLGLLAYFTVTRFGAVSIVLGLAAAVTGILALRAGRRGRAIAGLVLGLIALPSAAVMMMML
jgi:hypothetical protein